MHGFQNTRWINSGTIVLAISTSEYLYFDLRCFQCNLKAGRFMWATKKTSSLNVVSTWSLLIACLGVKEAVQSFVVYVEKNAGDNSDDRLWCWDYWQLQACHIFFSTMVISKKNEYNNHKAWLSLGRSINCVVNWACLLFRLVALNYT